MSDKTEVLKVVSYGAGGFSLEGVQANEIDFLLGSFIGGYHWVRRGSDGSLEHVPSYEELPKPTADKEILPFWESIPLLGDIKVRFELYNHTTLSDEYSRHASPSITIQHLCGYNRSDKGYKHQAELLESYGFECLRSRRGNDGKYWELWFLPGISSTKGSLREAVKGSGYRNEKLQAKVVVEFLRRHASFGTLDISVQRLAQILE